MRTVCPFCLLLCAVLGTAFAGETTRPDRTVRVPMRDGVRLATDIYLPAPDARGLPALLVRTPYDRRRYNGEFGSMARWGYAVVIQDCRGRFGSEGRAMAFLDDGWGARRDGYDTVRWITKQDFSNGRVGTLGASAMGITQYLMAPTRPPGLVCQYVLVAPASLYHHSAYPGGVLREKMVVDWLRGHAEPEALRRTLDHPLYDDHWRPLDVLPAAERVNVPILHYGGWYDVFSQGTIDAFVTFQEEGGEGARGRQTLVMGPWTHGGQSETRFGDFRLPESARSLPVDLSARRFFDAHLKREEKGWAGTPPVVYYVMGPFDGIAEAGNFWRRADSWPPPSTETSWHLTAAGRLRTETGGAAARSFRYEHDPDRPVPTIGGGNLYIESGPKDQRPIEERDDVLVFTSDPLERDLEVTGRLRAVVTFATEATDTDVVLRLSDVYPDGRSILIADGIRRLSSVPPATPRDPRVPRQVEVDLWSTSIVFAKGHRLRLSVSSSSWPRWEVNPGTGLRPFESPLREVQKNSLHVGGDHVSRLVLPVVEPSDARDERERPGASPADGETRTDGH